MRIVLAKNNSKNRPAGTPEVKGVFASRKTNWNKLLTKVFPAINAKWPAADSNWRIVIQQDNASLHVPADNPVILASREGKPLTTSISFQPAQSLDMNVLNLGLFAALQSMQRKKTLRNLTRAFQVDDGGVQGIDARDY